MLFRSRQRSRGFFTALYQKSLKCPGGPSIIKSWVVENHPKRLIWDVSFSGYSPSPHGDGNQARPRLNIRSLIPMQPTPLTGTATLSVHNQHRQVLRMQLTPLTGTATAFWPLRAHDVGCSSHPSRVRLPSTCSGKRHGFCRAFLLCSFPLRPPRLCPCSGLQCLDFGGGGGTPALPLHPNREQVRPFPGG